MKVGGQAKGNGRGHGAGRGSVGASRPPRPGAKPGRRWGRWCGVVVGMGAGREAVRGSPCMRCEGAGWWWWQAWCWAGSPGRQAGAEWGEAFFHAHASSHHRRQRPPPVHVSVLQAATGMDTRFSTTNQTEWRGIFPAGTAVIMSVCPGGRRATEPPRFFGTPPLSRGRTGHEGVVVVGRRWWAGEGGKGQSACARACFGHLVAQNDHMRMPGREVLSWHAPVLPALRW